MAPSNSKPKPQTVITFCICKRPQSQLQHLRPKYLVSRAAQTIKKSPTDRTMLIQTLYKVMTEEQPKEKWDRSEFSK
jgi:hypothetical protein